MPPGPGQIVTPTSAMRAPPQRGIQLRLSLLSSLHCASWESARNSVQVEIRAAAARQTATVSGLSPNFETPGVPLNRGEVILPVSGTVCDRSFTVMICLFCPVGVDGAQQHGGCIPLGGAAHSITDRGSCQRKSELTKVEILMRLLIRFCIRLR